MSKSFIVTSLGHSYRFTPEDIGYSVTEVGVRGVNTQGDTFEEALTNAHEASREMAEFRVELKAETAAKSKKSSKPVRCASRKRRFPAEVHAT